MFGSSSTPGVAKAIFLLFLASVTHASVTRDFQSDVAAREVKVTNGEQIAVGEYPFLTAVLSGRQASLKLGSRIVSGEYLGAGLQWSFEGQLFDCGRASSACAGAAGKVCTIEFDFATTDRPVALKPAQQLSHCSDAGGVGAIFRSGGGRYIRPDLYNEQPSIPAVFINSLPAYDALMFTLAGGSESYVKVQNVVAETIQCGGTYLGDLWVLTAAHCVMQTDAAGSIRVLEPQELMVNVGAHDLRSEKDFAQPVAQVVPGNYRLSGSWGENDYALLRLEALPLRGEPVELISRENLDASSAAAEQALVLGWGSHIVREPLTPIPSVPPVSATPLSALLTLHSTEVCQTQWRSFLRANNLSSAGLNIRSIHVCASNPQQQQDTCQGDSGGPLLVRVAGQWQLAGVTSFGMGCGAQDSVPGVYASVPSFSEWINLQTGQSKSDPVVQVQFSGIAVQNENSGAVDITLMFLALSYLFYLLFVNRSVRDSDD